MTRSLPVVAVRSYLKRNPTLSVCPGALANALEGETEPRVRAALELLRSGREVVSCRVIRGDVVDDEYRITAGVAPGVFDVRLRGADRPQRVRKNPRGEGALWQGRTPMRQLAIVAFIERLGRPATPGEIIAHFRDAQEPINASAIYCSVRPMLKHGRVVRCAKRVCTATGRVSNSYAPEAIAKRDTSGSGGEAGNGQAGLKPAARSGDEATRPSTEKTAPSGAGVRAGPVFGLLPNGALAIRGEEVGIDLSPALTRALCAWLDGRAGSRLVERLLR